eukprot:11081901-Ditylum_brightwellii.AAC.1
MMVSSTIPTANEYKLGDTMNIVQGDVVGQIIESGQDEMSWWDYTKLEAKNDKIITIITAYQLCKVSKKNDIIAYHQQITILQQAGRSITSRNAFVQDLLKWMETGHQKEKALFWE